MGAHFVVFVNSAYVSFWDHESNQAQCRRAQRCFTIKSRQGYIDRHV